MKKRWISGLIALAMCMTLAVPVMAAPGKVETISTPSMKIERIVGTDGDSAVVYLSNMDTYVQKGEEFKQEYALIQADGKVTVPYGEYDWMSPPRSGAVTVTRGGKYGLIDLKGNVLVPLGTYETLSEPENGYVRTTATREYRITQGLIDTRGREVIPTGTYQYVSIPADGRVVVQDSTYLYGVVDLTGRTVVPCSLEQVYGGYEDGRLIFSQLSRGVGLMDTEGKVIFQNNQYGGIDRAGDGFRVYDYLGQVALLDRDGNVLIPFGAYQSIGDYSCGRTLVYDREYNMGILDTGMKTVAELGKYGKGAMDRYVDGLLQVDLLDRDGIPLRAVLLDVKGNVLNFGNSYDFDNNFQLDTSTMLLEAMPLENGTETGSGYFLVEYLYAEDGERGIIDSQGNVVIGKGRYRDYVLSDTNVLWAQTGTRSWTALRLPESGPNKVYLKELETNKPQTTRYTDVAADAWFAGAVEYVSARNVMSGVGDGRFDPNGTTSRGMVMTMLARLEGVDVTRSEPWYLEGQNWAIVQGISDGSNPNGTVTREQLISMLYRYAQWKNKNVKTKVELTDYLDAGMVSEYAVPAMKWAVEKGVLQGSGSRLNPTAPASRAETAMIFMNFLQNIMK